MDTRRRKKFFLRPRLALLRLLARTAGEMGNVSLTHVPCAARSGPGVFPKITQAAKLRGTANSGNVPEAEGHPRLNGCFLGVQGEAPRPLAEDLLLRTT